MVAHNPNEIYQQMSEDELADCALAMKESIATARDTLARCENELKHRLEANGAKRLQGKRFLVKSTLRREIKWDQEKLEDVLCAAIREDHSDLFNEAFPLTYGCSIRKLNELLKYGGATAEAIEAAKAEVKETLTLEYEPL